MSKSARDVAADALMQWERDDTYSNIAIDRLLQSHAMSPEDAAFTTRLVYGVIERCLTLDWLLGKAMRRTVETCQPSVRAILRVAVYQLVFMDKIPSAAAVHEAVEQTRRFRQAKAAGFVNGVLRTVDREHKGLLQSVPTDLKGMSVRHSVPLALLKVWDKAYGRDHAVALAAAANDAPPSAIRVNTVKTDTASFLKQLTDLGIAYEAVTGLPDAVIVHDVAALRRQIALNDRYYFQDTASQWACLALSPEKGDRILDVCAAPGGKSLTTAMNMGDTGEILSCDVYDHKVATLRRRAEELGVISMRAVCRDAAQPLPREWEEAFDRVICDVPCSGYGVIRRRPEIRYKPLSVCDGLPPLQYAILCQAARAVKPGGVLQYSTCTLNPSENEAMVARFLEEHPSFVPRVLPLSGLFEQSGVAPSHQLTMMPHIHSTDGFFVASFRKEGLA